MNPVTCSSPPHSSLASTCTQPIRRHVVQYKLVFPFWPLLCCLYFYITRVSFARYSVFSSRHQGPLSSFYSVARIALMFLIKFGGLFLIESPKYLLFSFVKGKVTKTSCRTSENLYYFCSLNFYYELQCAT